ncbi:unnamed protein product, partial [Mesorhabditis belari]|uniref:Uncharacterized protein n=1 Tax=Mesorhabditis belari TaxID=2138241 RepID=A0AAF3EED5_9BILA
MRCILLFCSLIGLTFAVSCWSDSSDNEKHTKEKKVMDCGSDCNYCAKGTGKFKAGTINGKTSGSLWLCGCGLEIITLTGVECKDKGSQSVSNAYVDDYFKTCDIDLKLAKLTMNIWALIFRLHEPACCMCFCGYKTYNGMSNVVASAKTRRLQRQLFYSLVTLTAIPLAFIYGPLVLCFLGPIVGLGMGRFGIVYHWLLTIPPFFEPIVLIYFIGDYRRAALGILGRLDCCSLFPQIWRGELFTSSAYKTSTANNSTQQTRPSSEVNRSENDRNNL